MIYYFYYSLIISPHVPRTSDKISHIFSNFTKHKALRWIRWNNHPKDEEEKEASRIHDIVVDDDSEENKIEPPHVKTNNVTVRPAKIQISLGIRPVWSESSLCAQWVAKDPSFLHADSEDFDQTGRMPRLIWVFAGRTVTLFVLSCCGSCIFQYETCDLVASTIFSSHVVF